MASTNNSKSVIGLFAFIFVCFVITIAFAFSTFDKLITEETSLTSGGGKRAEIAVITVEGAIMSSKEIIELLQEAETNKSIKGIILKINSPGGAVGPTQEIYEEIIRIDAIKPIYTSMESVAASGGYYLAAGTRKIYANAGTLTGSIGVIMQFMDISKLYEFVKVQPKIIKAGKYKDIGSEARAMTAEEEALMNETIQNVHAQFIRDIKARRNLEDQKLIDAAQGQIFSGEQAKEVGLVDEIGGLYKAARQMHTDLALEGEFAGVRYIEKKKKTSLRSLLEALNDNLSNLNVEKVLNNSSSIPQLYFK